MNKHPYKIFYFDPSSSISLNEVIRALHPGMISTKESAKLGFSSVVKLYNTFTAIVKENPGLRSYHVNYPWSAASGRLLPNLERDFEIIAAALGWKVEWSEHYCTVSVDSKALYPGMTL